RDAFACDLIRYPSETYADHVSSVWACSLGCAGGDSATSGIAGAAAEETLARNETNPMAARWAARFQRRVLLRTFCKAGRSVISGSRAVRVVRHVADTDDRGAASLPARAVRHRVLLGACRSDDGAADAEHR